jgi:GT2 family glycosyltransferase
VIGLVIPVYAATKAIARTTVESIEAHAADLPDYAQLVIVRNGGQRSCCASSAASAVVDLPVNLGFTAAVNVGLRTAAALGADYYVVSSADVFPQGDWLQGMMADGLCSALETPYPGPCTHDLPCPFWGGMFGFPQALLDDVGYLPEAYTRIGDAAFAARAALLGWPVQRGPAMVEHRHPHAANDHADPAGSVMSLEKGTLAREYGRNLCALLDHLDHLDPAARLKVAREAR